MPIDGRDEARQTNEIGKFIPLLADRDIIGKTITADALLTQRRLAQFLGHFTPATWRKFEEMPGRAALFADPVDHRLIVPRVLVAVLNRRDEQIEAAQLVVGEAVQPLR